MLLFLDKQAVAFVLTLLFMAMPASLSFSSVSMRLTSSSVDTMSRGEWLGRAARGGLATAGWLAAAPAPAQRRPQAAARAAVYAQEVPSGQWKVADASKAEGFFPQILAGYKELCQLDKNWEKIVVNREDGDVIRRYLGTVGVKSPLFQINKAFNGVKDAVGNNPDKYEDTIEVVDFVEASNDALQHIQQADFLAYSQNFANFGNGGGGEDYIALSRVQVKEAIASYKDILEALSLGSN